ncbi:MAG: hypothetical protein ACFFBD_09775 [Candidatus Hodarchaeota archaeon]
MVAVTEAIPYEELVKQLTKKDRIAIFTCNTCTRTVGNGSGRKFQTGGAEFMHDLTQKLTEDGYNVTDEVILGTACFEDFIREVPISDAFTKGIVLACDAGWAAVKRHLPKNQIIKGLKTLGILIGRGPKPVVLLEAEK